MKKKLRVAIIGCGRILPMHAVPATVLEQSELVAVCDIRAERAKPRVYRRELRVRKPRLVEVQVARGRIF